MSAFTKRLLYYIAVGASFGAFAGGFIGAYDMALTGMDEAAKGPKDKEWVAYKQEFDSTVAQLEKLGITVLPEVPYQAEASSRPLNLRISLRNGDIIKLDRGFFGGGSAEIKLDKYMQFYGTNFPAPLKERIMNLEARHPKFVKKYNAFISAGKLASAKRSGAYTLVAGGLGTLGGAGAAIVRRRKEIKSQRRTGRR